MKQLMRYQIISGRTVEKRDVLMDISPSTRKEGRRGKYTGKQKAAQVERNMNEASKRLARILNCNFEAGDLFLTLKYSDALLPSSTEEAKRNQKNFLRRMARAYRRLTGKKLKWVAVTADRSSKTGLPVRLHHHFVMDRVAYELVIKHWPKDYVNVRHLDGSGDYTGVAIYMIRNAGYQRGCQTWSSSNGLDKPIFTPPVPVKECGNFRVPKTATVTEREIHENKEDGFSAGYIRYVLPEEGFPNPQGGRACPRAGGSSIAIPARGGGRGEKI